jgi:hypothetical protein
MLVIITDNMKLSTGGLMRTNSIQFVVLIFIFTCLLFSGCTIIGYGIGATYDQIGPKPKPRPGALEDPKIGQKIIVEFMDSHVLEGHYIGVTRHDYDEDLYIRMFDGEETILIPYESIQQIFVMAEGDKIHTGKVTGIIIGLSIDVIVFYLWARGLSKAFAFH